MTPAMPESMTATEFRRHLKRLDACSDGRAWVGRRDLATAWNECERADWLLWLAGHAGVDRRALVRAAADCAETALQYVPEGETRPREAIEAARRWADAPTEANRQAARASANASAYTAAYAAAYAAYDAAYAAAYAAYAAYAVATRGAALREMCVLVRRHISVGMVQAALRGEASDADAE